ncbi:pacearchaeosortase [Candidatus Pacearchaeota archaeon]|nr:pacearchaeosortase [Candidatus Pacearchaeota archaeon]
MLKKRAKRAKPNNKTKFSIVSFAIRYILLILFGIGNLFIIYFILTPLTIYPVYWILDLFYKVIFNPFSKTIFIGKYQIELINACIAGAAYYLLLILNLSTKMNARKRIYSLIYSILALLILNILRVIILSVLFVNDFLFFDFTHKVFWYALSIVFVIAIWFSSVYLFRIRNIPIYSDFKNLIQLIRRK